jgi:tetratricopeptide (TPR) repeat protein
VIFDQTKALLVQSKDYGVLLNLMGLCHKELQQWGEAVVCCKEAVEHRRNLYGNSHPEYATSLFNLAVLFADLKQYEEAIPRMEEVLTIHRKVFGDKHDRTLDSTEQLALVRILAKRSDRGGIDVGHNFRMCSCCGAVSEIINTCPCVRAWYCNADCQLQHWQRTSRIASSACTAARC